MMNLPGSTSWVLNIEAWARAWGAEAQPAAVRPSSENKTARGRTRRVMVRVRAKGKS